MYNVSIGQILKKKITNISFQNVVFANIFAANRQNTEIFKSYSLIFYFATRKTKGKQSPYKNKSTKNHNYFQENLNFVKLIISIETNTFPWNISYEKGKLRNQSLFHTPNFSLL